jgi:hypothetical protein
MDVYGLVNLIKIPKYRVKATKDERTPRSSIRKMLATIPESEWKDPNKHWADFAVGRGNIAAELVDKLSHYHSLQWIADHLWVLDIDSAVLYTTRAVLEKKLGIKKLNIIHADFLTWTPPPGIKFNIVFNPVSNITKAKSANGTSGDVGAWARHLKQAQKHMDSYLIMWAIKGGFLKALRTQWDYEVIAIDLMTDEKYWNKNFCSATLHSKARTIKNLDTVVIDRCAIIKCVSVMGDNPCWKEINGNTNKKSVNYSGANAVKAIVKLPGAKNKIQYGRVDPDYGGLVPAGPKFIGTLLESEPSYTVTNMPVAAPFMGCYSTSAYGDDIENAKRIKLFVQKNQLLKAIQQRLQTKGPTWTLRHIRPFDPAQIVTGYEIPKEWNLTADEVDELLGSSVDFVQ